MTRRRTLARSSGVIVGVTLAETEQAIVHCENQIAYQRLLVSRTEKEDASIARNRLIGRSQARVAELEKQIESLRYRRDLLLSDRPD